MVGRRHFSAALQLGVCFDMGVGAYPQEQQQEQDAEVGTLAVYLHFLTLAGPHLGVSPMLNLKWLLFALGTVIVGGAVLAVYMPINSFRSTSPPVVDADAKPYKSKPLDPGGEHIPDQEKQIYPATSGHPPKDDAILAEAPEQPMSKPQPVIVRQVGKRPN